MKKFDISTDSNCDLYADEIEKLGIFVGKLTYVLEKDNTLTECLDDFKTYDEYVNFYNLLRSGVKSSTSILNLQAHIDLFTEMAEKGIKNALHIAQSDGLSPTIVNAKKAIEIVKEKFPDINYLAMESKTTTIGEGMLVQLACRLRDEGKTNAEVMEILENEKKHIQHFVIVEDLMYLKRGGRISGPKAAIGTLLGIKPIIQFTQSGKLEISSKELGIKKALRTAVDAFGEFTKSKYFDIKIVHTDNLPLAEKLQAMIEEKYGIKPEIRIMGPIIGTHIGPNAVAYGFLSNEDRPIP